MEYAGVSCRVSEVAKWIKEDKSLGKRLREIIDANVKPDPGPCLLYQGKTNLTLFPLKLFPTLFKCLHSVKCPNAELNA